MNLQLKFKKSSVVFGHFFQSVEIFTVLPVKFSTNCLMWEEIVKRNQSLTNICFNVLSKHCRHTMASNNDLNIAFAISTFLCVTYCFSRK